MSPQSFGEGFFDPENCSGASASQGTIFIIFAQNHVFLSYCSLFVILKNKYMFLFLIDKVAGWHYRGIISPDIFLTYIA